jgi:hypothetical protein
MKKILNNVQDVKKMQIFNVKLALCSFVIHALMNYISRKINKILKISRIIYKKDSKTILF